MAGPRHYDDELQEHLDGRLPADQRAELEAHLADCPQCRLSYEQLAWTRRQAAKAGAGVPVPSSLVESIGRALDEEDRRTAARVSRLVPLGWPAMAWGMAALLLVGFGLWYRNRPPALPDAAARDYRDYRSGRLALELVSSDVVGMERFFAARGVPFPTRVFDLGMMKYALVGGRVHALAGHLSALFVYRGEDGHTVVCQMYQAPPTELPTPEVVREHDGISFSVYRRNGVSLVFWSEGSVMCVLAADGDTEAVVQLAFAKAMKVASGRHSPEGSRAGAATSGRMELDI